MNTPAFFRLMPVLDDQTPTIDLLSHEDFSFTRGLRFEEPFPTPVRFRLHAPRAGASLPTLFLPEPVINRTFLAALREAGVTNVADYPAWIANASGARSTDEYRAVNILGNVSCADLTRSEFEAFEGMYFFDRLVIDRDRVGARLCFRVEEAHEFIVLASELAQRLDLARFPDVRLVPIDSA